MKGVRSLLGVPLLVEGAILGVLHVGTVTPREFTNADAALLQLAAAQAAPAIDRARLFDALDREHRNAVALQRSLLPDRLPNLVGIDTAARYLPARDEVGGDWYDVIDLPGGQVGLGIGDVAGHGLRAASLMGQLRAGLRAYALDGHSPGTRSSAWTGCCRRSRARGWPPPPTRSSIPRRARCATPSAGHPPPVLIRGGREATCWASRAAPPLGSLPFSSFPEIEDKLAADDTILLYTDGLDRTPHGVAHDRPRAPARAGRRVGQRRAAVPTDRRSARAARRRRGRHRDRRPARRAGRGDSARALRRRPAGPLADAQDARAAGCRRTARRPTRSLPSRSPAARRAPTRSSMPMLPAWPTSSSRRGTRTGS